MLHVDTGINRTPSPFNCIDIETLNDSTVVSPMSPKIKDKNDWFNHSYYSTAGRIRLFIFIIPIVNNCINNLDSFII